MRPTTFLRVFLLLVVFGVNAAGAQNLLTDSDFDDSSLSAWNPLSGLWTWNAEDADGDPASGSSDAQGAFEFGALRSQCVDVGELKLIELRQSARQISSSHPQHSLLWSFYSGAGCSGGSPILSDTISGPLSTSWSTAFDTVRSPTGTMSLGVTIGEGILPLDDVIRVDDVRAEVALFEDTMNDETAFGWDAIVGGPMCPHSVCSVGVVMSPACDSCVAAVCLVDPYCCETEWDLTCVNQVNTNCTGIGCL